MRILLLSQFFPPTIGGEERHVKVLGNALAQRGHDVSLATLRQDGEAPFEIVDGVRVHRLQGTLARCGGLFSDPVRRHAPPFPDPELTWRLGRLVNEFKPDVVHAHNWLLHSYLPLSAMTRSKLIVTLHDYGTVCAKKNLIHDGNPCAGPKMAKCLSCAGAHFGRIKGAVTWLANTASRAAMMKAVDAFIPVSRAVAERCDLDRAGVAYDIIPTFMADDTRSLLPEPDDRLAELPAEPYLLFVGDLTYLKGLHALIAAYEMLADAPPLVLIGRRCKDTPTRLPPNVRLFESWPHQAVLQAWKRCLFGLLPSIGLETCGTVVMEANAFGKPVIGCRVGGLRDTIVHGRTGLLVAPNDVGALAAAMKSLIGDGALRERLGAAADRHADTYMTRAIVPRIEDIYLRCLTPEGSALVGAT